MLPVSQNSRRIRRQASGRCNASHFKHARLIRYPLGEHLRDVSYDAAGRISAYTHYIAATGSIAPAQDQQFSYDSLSRLTQVSSALATWRYTYDANGNRTSAGVNSAAPSVYTLDNASNRLLQVSNPANTLAYDNAGNIVSGGAYTLSYDLRGRMSSIARIGATTTYTYDNHGQRLRKHSGFAAGTSVFAYDPQGQLLGEYDSAGNAIREYVWLDGMPVAMFTPDPAAGANAASSPPLVYYIHADHLNTPRVLVDMNNAMRWRWLGEPFGTTAPEISPQGLPSLTFNLRHPGQFYDVESGMFYNLNRDYVPGAGRYTQNDPIGLAGGIDTYGYVGGNPVNNIDPDGLQIVIPIPGRRPIPIDPTDPRGPTYTPTPTLPNWLTNPFCKDDTSREECKQSCVAQYDRDAAECGVAYSFWGRKGYQACMARAGDYLARCTKQCDGK